MLTDTSPLLATVIVFARLFVPTGWLPKFTVVGVNCMYVPVPVSDTFCGLPGALSVIEREPVSMPIVVGLKLTLMVQLAPGLTIEPQVCV